MRARVPRSRVSHDRWLVSYADFVTLLFGFFVVLYAFARSDQKKQVQIVQAIDSAFKSMGVFSNSNQAASAQDAAQPAHAAMSEESLTPLQVKYDLNRIQYDLSQTLAKQIATHAVSLQMGRDGLVISLREAGFFDSGSATPKAEALPTLRQIADRLGATPYDLRIEGHTDNVPIHTAEFDSNWELSAARATHIARLFLEMNAIPPDRLSAAGFAEFHPVAGNDTAEGRAENRRVDLVVLPRIEDQLCRLRRRSFHRTVAESDRRISEPASQRVSSAGCFLFDAENFDDHPLAALAVELGIENTLPGTKVEVAVGDRQSGLVVQQQRLEMRVAVVLAGLVVLVVGTRRGQFLEPFADVLNEPALMIVHVNGGRNVHGRDKAEAIFHAAAANNTVPPRR